MIYMATKRVFFPFFQRFFFDTLFLTHSQMIQPIFQKNTLPRWPGLLDALVEEGETKGRCESESIESEGMAMTKGFSKGFPRVFQGFGNR